MNPVAHTPWQPSRAERIADFAEVLRSARHRRTTIRRNRGIEIGAACGQLAAELAEHADAGRHPAAAAKPARARSSAALVDVAR